MGLGAAIALVLSSCSAIPGDLFSEESPVLPEPSITIKSESGEPKDNAGNSLDELELDEPLEPEPREPKPREPKPREPEDNTGDSLDDELEPGEPLEPEPREPAPSEDSSTGEQQDASLPLWEDPKEAPQGGQDGYKITPEIEDTIQALQLTDYGRGLFLGASPEYVSSREAMQEICEIEGEMGDRYRGCYTGYEHRIVTLATDIEVLQSVKNVIMAHELLHAAWRYYSEEKREELTTEIDTFLETLPEDAEVFDRISTYDTEEKSDIPNEYHSFLATVEMDLSPYLEDHYSTYFKNRKNVVTLYRAFDKLAKSYLDDIEALDYQGAYDAYMAERDAYRSEREILNEDIRYFNANNSTYSREKAKEEEAALVARVEEIDARKARLGEQYDILKDLLEEHNLLVTEHAALIKKYNSVYE